MLRSPFARSSPPIPAADSTITAESREAKAKRTTTGMTKAEVKGLLGTPLLADAFHGERWDYYFSNVAGRRSSEQARLSVFFKDEKLVSFSGNGRPPGESPARSPAETPRPQLPGK